ncbi:MAG: NADH:ubiquinone reductase (Na(+)-transporting) subunit D [Planctomycetes bacterium]|nr:NADH:ubiquinone reductase (Na(+)-transporting) subunit D [Planctomycetota bacterium]
MNGSGQAATGSGALMLRGLWYDNAIVRQVLGICSTLAVTNRVLNTMVMCAALVAATGLSSWTISVMRRATPRSIRMMVETLIIAFYVILFDRFLRAYWPDMSRQLGPYVGLIITNCIIMGRAEAFANANRPLPSLVDGVANGLGYSFVLLIVATTREAMGIGTFLGMPLPFFSGAMWDRWILLVMPPGAFFTLALVIWAFRSIGMMQREEGS